MTITTTMVGIPADTLRLLDPTMAVVPVVPVVTMVLAVMMALVVAPVATLAVVTTITTTMEHLSDPAKMAAA